LAGALAAPAFTSSELSMRWTGRVRFLFLFPAVVWVLAFTAFPLCYSLYLAFFKVEQKVEITRVKEPVMDAQGQPVLDAQGKPRTKNVVQKKQVNSASFVGLQNFKRLFKDPQVGEAIRVTATFVLVAVPLELVLGFLLAVLFNRQIFGRPVLRAAMLLPIFATPLAVGYTFFTIFYEVGGPLGWMGIPFLSNPDWALFSVILVDVWQWTPFCFLVFLAALQGVPDELYEAALIDGAGPLSMLTRVLLPVLQPTIIIVLLLRLAEALKLFDIPFALTGGGPGIATQPYSLLAFRTGLRFFDLGYASAMAYGLLAVVMVIITVFFRRMRETYG
jgi:multiple sugar transport system permease protein